MARQRADARQLLLRDIEMVAKREPKESSKNDLERVIAEYREWLRVEREMHPFPGEELDAFVQSILSPEALIGSAAWGDDEEEEQELDSSNAANGR
jgi:hypothetical protein